MPAMKANKPGLLENMPDSLDYKLVTLENMQGCLVNKQD